MPQIIQGNPGFGATFGSGLGSGLSSGLKMLAESKLQELNQKNQKAVQNKAFKGVFTDEFSDLLSAFPQDKQTDILKILGGSGSLGAFARQPQQNMFPQQSQDIDSQGSNGLDLLASNDSDQNIQGQEMSYAQPQIQAQAYAKNQNQPSIAEVLSRPSKKELLDERKVAAREKSVDIQASKLNKAANEKLLEAHDEEMKLAVEIDKTARDMLEILNEHPGKLPQNYLSKRLPADIWGEEKASLYDAYAKKLAILESQSRRGNPTDSKQELELAIKAGLEKPLGAQKKLLSDILGKTGIVFKRDKTIRDIVEKHNGNFPNSLRSKVLGTRHNPLVSNKSNEPVRLNQAIEQGATKVRNRRTGEIGSIVDGQFVPEKG